MKTNHLACLLLTPAPEQIVTRLELIASNGAGNGSASHPNARPRPQCQIDSLIPRTNITSTPNRGMIPPPAATRRVETRPGGA